MPIVQMPDGALVELPDNPDPALLAEIEAAIAPENPLKRQAKLIGSDVVKGGLGLPAMAMDVGREVLNIPFTLGEQLGDKVMGRKPQPYAPIGPKASAALQDFGVKPQTEAEKWQSLLTQGAVGGVASPGGLTRPLLQATTGAAAAGGSEIAARLGGDNLLMRGLGGVLGGGLAGLGGSFLNRSSPRVTELARESLDGLTPAQLTAARTFMEGAGKNGMPLDFAQALEATGAQPSGMRVLRDTLANVKEGDATQALLKEQPGRLQDLSARWVGNQPGRIFSPEQAANNLGETATNVVEGLNDRRSALWRDVYKQTLQKLRAQKLPAVQAAAQAKEIADTSLAQAEKSLGVLREQASVLEGGLARSQLDDAFAVARANPKPLALPEGFVLPRGRTADNRGNLLPEVKRGESIIFSQLAKETRDARPAPQPLPEIPNAPSLPTLQAEKALIRQQDRIAAQATVVEDRVQTAARQAELLREAENQFKALKTIPKTAADREVARLLAEAAKVPNTPKAKLLQKLARDLNGLTDAEQINEVLKAAAARTSPKTLATPPQMAAAHGFLQKQIAMTRNNLAEGFEPYRAANTAYSDFTKTVINPVKQGQVGMLTGRTGYDAATQTPVSRMNALFAAGRDPAAKHSPLLETARTLNKQDPTAFADAAKTYYSGRIAEAFDAGIGAGGKATNKDAGSKIYSSLFADSKQYAGMRDVVTATAEAAGRKPAEALRGLENFAKIVRATRSQPDVIGGMSRQQIIEMAEKHYGANAIRIFGFLPFERMARNMESATMTRTFREMDKLITTPEGVDILIKLSQTPVMDKRALALAATAGGMLQFAGKTDQNTPE